MLPVSEAFRTAAQAVVRKPLQRVTCWFADNRSLESITTITVPGELDATDFPKENLINSRTQAPKTWALARDDCYPADDLFPIDEGWEGGWFSDTVAGAGGAVAPAQEIIFEYSTDQYVQTFEVWGDDWLGYPVDFKWYYYDEPTLAYVEAASVTGNTAEYHLTTLATPVLTGKVKLEISKISRANDYPAVMEIQTTMATDLSSRVQSLTIVKERAYRREGSIPLGNVAAAELNLVLDNADGAFFVGNTASPYYGYILPNRKIKVELGFVLADGSSEYCDAGVFYTARWKSPARSAATTVRALDGWKILKRTKWQGPVVESNSISELVTTVAAAGGLAGGDVAIDDTYTDVPYAPFDDKTLFEHLKALAIGEGGAVYFDESGVFCFEDRDHLDAHAATGVTIDQDTSVEDATDEVDEGTLVNRVRVQSSRLAEAAQTTIWSLQETVNVPPSGSVTFDVRFQGAAVDIAAPVIVTGGADVTVDSYSYDSYGGTITLANAGAVIETVTAMTIDGKLLEEDGQIIAEAEAPLSVNDYGEQAYSLSNEYIQSLDQAQSLADDLLDAYNALGTELVVAMKARGLPHLQLGDKVHVDCTQAHISFDGWVVRSRLNFADGLHGELTVLTEGIPVPDFGLGYITGTVQLEGRTDYSGVTVSSSGYGDPVQTAADGSFTLAVRPGTGITVTAALDGYLSAAKTGVTVTLNDTTDIGATTLLGGDVNGDALVNSTDMLIVLTYQAGMLLLPGPYPAADIDGNGVVEAFDLLILLTNLDKAGPTAW